MILNLVIVLLVLWVLMMSIKFYRRMNWDEPAEPTPDFSQLRKREAELAHIQDVLDEACREGKLQVSCTEEFRRFADQELAALKDAANSCNPKA